MAHLQAFRTAAALLTMRRDDYRLAHEESLENTGHVANSGLIEALPELLASSEQHNDSATRMMTLFAEGDSNVLRQYITALIQGVTTPMEAAHTLTAMSGVAEAHPAAIPHMIAAGAVPFITECLSKQFGGQMWPRRTALQLVAVLGGAPEPLRVPWPLMDELVSNVARCIVPDTDPNAFHFADPEAVAAAVTALKRIALDSGDAAVQCAVPVLHTGVKLSNCRGTQIKLQQLLRGPNGLAPALFALAKRATTAVPSGMAAVELLQAAGLWDEHSRAAASIIPLLTRALKHEEHVAVAQRLLRGFATKLAVGTAAFKAAVDALGDSGAIRDAVTALVEHREEDRSEAACSLVFVFKVCASPDDKHTCYVANSGLHDALPALLASDDQRYAVFARALTAFFESDRGVASRQELLGMASAVQVSLACTEMRDEVDADSTAIPRIVAAGALQLAEQFLGEAYDEHIGLQCSLLLLVADLARGYEADSLPAVFTHPELVKNVARHLNRDTDTDAESYAATALKLIANAAGGTFIHTEWFGVFVPDLITLAKDDAKPLSARLTAAEVLYMKCGGHEDFTSLFATLTPMLIRALSCEDGKGDYDLRALKMLIDLAAVQGDMGMLRQHVAALVRTVSSPTATLQQVAQACVWLADALKSLPAAIPNIVAAGIVPLVANHVADPSDVHAVLQCDILQLLTQLARGYEGRGAESSPFVDPVLVTNIARHVMRHADREAGDVAISALQAIKSIDDMWFAEALEQASLTIDFDLAPALVIHATSAATSLDSAMAAVELLGAARGSLDFGTLRCLVPLLTGALKHEHHARHALSLLFSFVTHAGGTDTAAVDVFVNSGTIREVVLTATPDARVADDAWALLAVVCASPNAAHKRHIADSGLLAALPALLASSEKHADFALRMLCDLVTGDIGMLRRYAATLVRAVSSPASTPRQVEHVCVWLADAVDADPAAIPHIAAAGALPLVANHLGGPDELHTGPQRVMHQLLFKLAAHTNDEAGATGHNASDADAEEDALTVTALQRIASCDTIALVHHDSDELSALHAALDTTAGPNAPTASGDSLAFIGVSAPAPSGAASNSATARSPPTTPHSRAPTPAPPPTGAAAPNDGGSEDELAVLQAQLLSYENLVRQQTALIKKLISCTASVLLQGGAAAPEEIGTPAHPRRSGAEAPTSASPPAVDGSGLRRVAGNERNTS